MTIHESLVYGEQTLGFVSCHFGMIISKDKDACSNLFHIITFQLSHVKIECFVLPNTYLNLI